MASHLPCGRPAAQTHSGADRSKFPKLQEQLRTYLTAQGLKYSEQRWKIAELILTTAGHSDAQAIVAKVKRRYPEIGAATVYRNLKVLCDAQIVKESLTDPNGRVIYELYDEDHHDHIICMDCGEIFEFHSAGLEKLQSGIVSEMKFDEVRHRHVIYAKCGFKKN